VALNWESAVSKKVCFYRIFLVEIYENQAIQKKKKKVLNLEQIFPVAKIKIFANGTGKTIKRQ